MSLVFQDDIRIKTSYDKWKRRVQKIDWSGRTEVLQLRLKPGKEFWGLKSQKT